MPWIAAVFAGMGVMVIVRLVHWLAIELTGDAREVSFATRVWLSFVATSTLLLVLEETIGDTDIVHEVLMLDRLAHGIFSVAAASLLFFWQGNKRSSYWLALVSCELARRVVVLVVWAMEGES
jgi:hypothetical protein